MVHGVHGKYKTTRVRMRANICKKRPLLTSKVWRCTKANLINYRTKLISTYLPTIFSFKFSVEIRAFSSEQNSFSLQLEPFFDDILQKLALVQVHGWKLRTWQVLHEFSLFNMKNGAPPLNIFMMIMVLKAIHIPYPGSKTFP